MQSGLGDWLLPLCLVSSTNVEYVPRYFIVVLVGLTHGTVNSAIQPFVVSSLILPQPADVM